MTGVAEEVTDPDEVERLRRLPLGHWVQGDDKRFVRISTDIVSGRRLGRRVDGVPRRYPVANGSGSNNSRVGGASD